MISLSGGIQKQNKKIENRKRLIETENKHVVAQQAAGGRGMEWKTGLTDANYYIRNG